MNLNELQESNKTKLAQRALKEHYNVKVDLNRLDAKSTREMLGKVRGALKEARTDRSQHASHQSPAYLKMLMMEQMLANHYADMKVSETSIVFENEEIQQAQVLASARALVDDLQKMLEKISKQKVEQLNAVVTGIKNEYGVAEGDQYNQTVNEALNQVEQALATAKQSVESALSTLTGEGGTPGGELGAEVGGAELGADVGAELGADVGGPEGAELGAELGGEEGADLGAEFDEPEAEVGPAGRGLR